MTDSEKKVIRIPEITRVEGHEAVTVDIVDGKVACVQLEVFEGTRFFEKIVVGHNYQELPHITSRVCAICSTGHVLAAIRAVESAFGVQTEPAVELMRELMHLGMIIESHATHVFALALPDFLGTTELVEFATKHEDHFRAWTSLRQLGALIQTVVGGRPFHPVNLQVGGFSTFPTSNSLQSLVEPLRTNKQLAINICEFLNEIEPPVKRLTKPTFLALVPDNHWYGFFGSVVRSSEGWEESIDNYSAYLKEEAVPYSHAKRSRGTSTPIMVGAMARLHLFGSHLHGEAKSIYNSTSLSLGDTNTILNNLAQAIELVYAIDRALSLIDELQEKPGHPLKTVSAKESKSTGAVECPRGTLYHSYEFSGDGKITWADMVTPSAQNSARIELDIAEVVNQSTDPSSPALQANLETLIRAYDPCNTCATHMVKVNYG